MLEGFSDHFEAIFGDFLVSGRPLGASWCLVGGLSEPSWGPLGVLLEASSEFVASLWEAS